MFKRKAYDKLLLWKNKYADNYACLLEGARGVGKSTIALNFAKNEYKSYILVDFSKADKKVVELFDNISDLDDLFLRLSVEYNTKLYKGASVIIFDEIQLCPKARQAIKHFVEDGRYHYIETGSLISIKRNVKDILIPSEEYKIKICPMDYDEFLWATGTDSDILKDVFEKNVKLGADLNNKLMRQYRIYMAVGGMPQAVDAYIETNNFIDVDFVKREILNLYYDDLKKIDSSGLTTDIYKSVPSQLATWKNRFVISKATGKQITNRDNERIFELIDSCIVIPCYNVLNPSVSLNQTRDIKKFKLYMSEIGLFVTSLFNDSQDGIQDIYKKLLSNKLSADLWYLYENVIAQTLVASGKELFYHTWRNEGSTHSYEIDFVIRSKSKIIPIEVKSSITSRHKSLDEFKKKYSKHIGDSYIISQKDIGIDGDIKLKPVYLSQKLFENI